MSLSLSVCSQSGPPICTSFWALFRAFKALKALRSNFNIFNASAVSRSTKPKIFHVCIAFRSLIKWSPKSVGVGSCPHFMWSIYRGGNFFLDEKSIDNVLEGQKCLVMCLFWGGCHQPNRNMVTKASRSTLEYCCPLWTPSIQQGYGNPTPVLCRSKTPIFDAFKFILSKFLDLIPDLIQLQLDKLTNIDYTPVGRSAI